GSLISNKKHLQAIYENAPIGFAMADMNGNLIASNPVFQRMLGYNSDELRKMTFKDITHKDDWEEDVRRFHEMLQNKR
ncbi:MAG: PAS domain S-box protein, partial [candidate division Zixibacteria bacterium]|nr:PAS domain S-box protein [candidate division Zixibacteria bacterium]NIR67762.1 PAS domain S-box protein [candidate division Zixibacteria bacterium]NIX59522.1 PAS domain S-box protein [candidate division Zixibacteria bacterium]